VARRAIEVVDFSIICGHRDKATQDKCFAEGTSKVRWPNSRHNKFPSEAMDVAPYPIDWATFPDPPWTSKEIKDYAFALSDWYHLAGVILGVAEGLEIEIEWGGHWKTLVDLPHFQIRRVV
jgi:peptidoglycan L-alanyl-D-glutamate endopeptidase CwlK